MLVRAHTPQSHLQSMRILRPYIGTRKMSCVNPTLFWCFRWTWLMMINYRYIRHRHRYKVIFCRQLCVCNLLIFSPHFGYLMSLHNEKIQISVGRITRTITWTMAYDENSRARIIYCMYAHKEVRDVHGQYTNLIPPIHVVFRFDAVRQFSNVVPPPGVLSNLQRKSM
jgi:hypothetical protein